MVDSAQRIAQLAAEVAEAASPLAALRTATELRRELDRFEREQVAFALAEGATFAGIARDLGVSRQAVHRRSRELGGGEEVSADARRILREARGVAGALGVRSPASEHVLLAALAAPGPPPAAPPRPRALPRGGARGPGGSLVPGGGGAPGGAPGPGAAVPPRARPERSRVAD